MPIVLSRLPIAYYAAPKVASTSIKMALYELEHGVPFKRHQDADGKWRHIHNSWLPKEPTLFKPVADSSFFKFCVVRDPIRRFLSAFGNRVHYHKELSQAVLAASPRAVELNLAPDPDLNTFVDHLHEYCEVSYVINHHIRPQCDFIGNTLSYFDKAYEFAELATMIADLSKFVGREICLPHEQQQGPKYAVSDLSPDRLQKLTDYYAREYAVLSRFYTPATPVSRPASLASFERHVQNISGAQRGLIKKKRAVARARDILRQGRDSVVRALKSLE